MTTVSGSQGPSKVCPAPSAPGFRFEEHDQVASTNNLCFQRGRAGASGNLWIRANEQVEGRGRRGRGWSSPRGNLFASLLLIDPEPGDRIGELPLLAAVALAEAIDMVAGTYRLAELKWPNDLLASGAKLSGILLEVEKITDDRLAVVLGFGVNCAEHPSEGLYRTTDLASLGYLVPFARLFDALMASVAGHLETWRQPGGFAPIRKAWLDRAAHLGKTITVRVGGEELTGVFADIDEKGHLVLKTAGDRRQTVYAGDVFF